MGSLVLQIIDQLSHDDYNALRATFDRNQRQDVDGYVDGAFFGWGNDDTLQFAAVRGDQAIVARLAGETSTFDARDPKANAPNGDVAGSEAGTDLWAIVTDVFERSGTAVRPTTQDLSGLWRTSDITPCAPANSVDVRVSRIHQSGRSVRATKVLGDTCLENNQTDFDGTLDNGRGAGLSYGTGPSADGVAYELRVISPVVFELTGQRGTLRYTIAYQRLSWPGLASQPKSSSLLGIPSPSDALTAKNVALTALLSLVLFVFVVIPSTLFDNTLQANLAHYRILVKKWRRRLSRRRLSSKSLDPAASTNAPPAKPQTPSAALRTRRMGIALYLIGAAMLFSIMQPGWGPNMATVVTFVGFISSLIVTSLTSVIATRTYLSFRYKQGAGVPTFEPATLGLAAFCVAASRFVGFVPGYLYGVVVDWEPEHRRDDFDRGRIAGFTVILTGVTAIVSWLAIPALRSFGGTDPSSLKTIPLATVSGVFVGAVNSLAIGMMPVEFFPGKILKRHNRVTWMLGWGFGAFMFVLVLLRPGLVSGSSQSVVGTLVLAALFGGGAVGFWAFHTKRLRRRATVLASPAPRP